MLLKVPGGTIWNVLACFKVSVLKLDSPPDTFYYYLSQWGWMVALFSLAVFLLTGWQMWLQYGVGKPLTDCIRLEDIYTKSWSKLWQNLTWQDDVEANCKTIFDFKRFVFLGSWIFSQLQEKKMVGNIITKGHQLCFSWGLHSTV